MGLYIFQHPETEEIKEIFQNMNDSHEYSEDGIKWNRLFTKPTAAIDTQWNADSKQDFINKTGSKKGTIGDILDKSAELSAERAKKEGKDKVKQDYFKNYSETRGGKMHLDQRKEKVKEITKDIVLKLHKKNN